MSIQAILRWMLVLSIEADIKVSIKAGFETGKSICLINYILFLFYENITSMTFYFVKIISILRDITATTNTTSKLVVAYLTVMM